MQHVEMVLPSHPHYSLGESDNVTNYMGIERIQYFWCSIYICIATTVK